MIEGNATVSVSNTNTSSANGNTVSNSNVSRFTNFNGGNTFGTMAVTVPSTDSVVVIALALANGNGDCTMEVYNDTTSTQIGTLTVNGSANTINAGLNQVVDQNPDLGVSNSYLIRSVGTGTLFTMRAAVQVLTVDESGQTVAVAKTNAIISG